MFLHSRQPPGGDHRPLLERCSVAVEWDGSLCTPHGMATGDTNALLIVEKQKNTIK